jgi:hypothetical protein
VAREELLPPAASHLGSEIRRPHDVREKDGSEDRCRAPATHRASLNQVGCGYQPGATKGLTAEEPLLERLEQLLASERPHALGVTVALRDGEIVLECLVRLLERIA